jgi:hypothetical protein
MGFLKEAESRILALIADNPGKYADLLDLLKGEAHKIGEALVHGQAGDESTAGAVHEAKEWASQSRERRSSAK